GDGRDGAPLVLVVEDSPTLRKMVRLALESEGYTVAEAESATQAIEAATLRKPQLILQDLLLPDMDGFDLVTALRSLTPKTAPPIIAVSGLVSKIEEARAASHGFRDFLT